MHKTRNLFRAKRLKKGSGLLLLHCFLCKLLSHSYLATAPFGVLGGRGRTSSCLLLTRLYACAIFTTGNDGLHEDKGIEVIDVGTNSTESFNYPISGYKVGKMVANGEVDGGVLICGTGVGISLAANKVKGVRACVCSEPYSARMSKQHNNSNIIAFGARVIGVETAKMIVDEWLNAKYEGGRHQVRVDMLTEIEQTQGLKVVDEQGQ